MMTMVVTAELLHLLVTRLQPGNSSYCTSNHAQNEHEQRDARSRAGIAEYDIVNAFFEDRENKSRGSSSPNSASDL